MPDVIKGKYQIVREIARSNDIVYEAIDTTFGRKIALKELNIASGVSGQARRERIERFNREARAAGKLSHPNIVSVFDFGEENGRYFIAMEYLEGQSLRDAMQARGAYPLHEALPIIYQVLDALSYAHANRVVHRDIKPDNIHILPGGQAKITDFGIARLGEEPALTGDGQVFGTPSYMSPEQIEGRNIDFRSDLFSAGILLYEMLAGRKPFIGDSVISITYAIMHAEPMPLNGIPQGIEQVIRRALSKQPQLRQISADQMKMDLKNAEQTPAIFLPAAFQTNMSGAYGRTGLGFGYNGTGAPVGQGNYGYSPQNTGYPPAVPSGPQASYTGGIPGYSPPSHAQLQPPGGALPWSWNTPSTHAQAAPNSAPPVYVPQQTYGASPMAPGGPGAPFPYASPPFPAVTPRPAIVLSPGAKTALKAVALAVVLGSVVAFGIIAVQNSYDRYSENFREVRVSQLMKEAALAYERGDYTTSVRLFEQAQNANPSVDQRSIIAANLAYSWLNQGLIAQSASKLREAKADYEEALRALPDYGLAHKKLAEVLQQLGDSAGAEEHRASSTDSSGGAGSMSPPAKLDVATPPPSSATSQAPGQFISEQRQAARKLIQEGDQLSKNGDAAGAREKWTAAVEKAPGTPERDEAAKRLDSGSDNSQELPGI